MSDKGWANPAPAGMMVLAFYLGCLWPVAAGMAPHELIYILVALGFCGGLIQVISGIIELRNGEIGPGNIMLAFSSFMWLGMLEKLLQCLKLLPPNTAAVDGWVFLIMALLMISFTPAYMIKGTAPTLFMVWTDVFFLFAGLFFLTSFKPFWIIATWDLPLMILTIIWQCAGIILNTTFKRQVISLGPPLIKIDKN